MYTQIKVTDAYKATDTLYNYLVWCEPVDDYTVEVFTADYHTALDILIDHFLLKTLVDFAEG